MSIISANTISIQVGPEPDLSFPIATSERVEMPVQSVEVRKADSGLLHLTFIHASEGIEVRFSYEELFCLQWKNDHRRDDFENLEVLRSHVPTVFHFAKIDDRFGPNLRRAVYDLAHGEVQPGHTEEDVARLVLGVLIDTNANGLHNRLAERWPESFRSSEKKKEAAA